MNAALDPSQGTISQGGQLSITAGSIDVNGTWNYGGQSVAIDGLNGITNNGTMIGAAPLTILTGGTFTNAGKVTGIDVTFNGALYNAANAVMHAGDVLTLNGDTTNRGTVEAVNALNVTGGSYDNQGATTQAQGNAAFNLGGTLLNIGGSIFAGNNVTINANAVVNDQTAPSAATSSSTTVVNSSLLWSTGVGQEIYQYDQSTGGENHTFQVETTSFNATLGDLLSPTGIQAADERFGGSCFNCAFFTSQPIKGSGTVAFNEYNVQVGIDSNGNASMRNLWFVGASADPSALASRTFALPTVTETTTSQTSGTPGVISAGGSISLTANSLSNQGGQLAAQGSITLNLQSLSNGAVAPTMTAQVTDSVDQAQLSSFIAQVSALGTVAIKDSGDPTATHCGLTTLCMEVDPLAPTTFSLAAGAAPMSGGTATTSSPTGMVAAGSNLSIYGGNLVNAGLLYAGSNVNVGAQSLTNQGGNQQNYSLQVGCADGVQSYACGGVGSPRGNNPNTTTFSYSQNDATIYAGNDLVIGAGQINNTYGNLLAGHNIVIGGVSTTATSTTAAQTLNNTSGNIVAGNDITLNVSGAITNNLPPPVQVHQNYGDQEKYNGCMTAGGYKESYCEGYVDQQSGSSSVISAGNDLQINAGTLTNIGSLIAAGNSATINVAGPVINEAQTLNAYWHSHWVQETGMFSSDKRHDIWACGSAAECTALYGSAYTSTGGTIDPPQPVGNVAATIQAPNLSISSDGQIQNIGNVLGTSVSLTGQRLINGITTANTYTPRVNNPSQVISLSPVDLPGLNLAMPRVVGSGKLPTPVAGKASYVDASLGSSAVGAVSPQALLSNLPQNLQPSSTLFYYNPQEEDLLLQQAALQQTGKASFVDGLTFDSKNDVSVTEQEKAYLYQNAIDYAKANDIQLGDALTQRQINTLDKPMLWYVEQTVPDPECKATGNATCPTITALMPQVYLPTNTAAMSAGGNIEGQTVTLNFDKDGNGSVLNTGSIAASGTLTVNTNTLTNEANQVNVGQIWQKVEGGYVDTTGTEVQPGGFMSAANMDLNVQTLNQIGGALQQLNADGTIDQAGTQQVLASLQQQLGGNFTQTALTDHLHTDFVKEGGGLPMFVVAALAIAASIVTAGAAAAAAGVVMTQLSVGSVLIGALGGMVGSAVSQVASGQGFNFGQILEAGAIGAVTAGAFAAMGASTQALQQFGSKIANGTFGLADLGNAVKVVVERGMVTATAETALEGANFGQALEGSAIGDLAAIGASAIGTEFNGQNEHPTTSNPLYVGSHAALGCVLSAAQGNGCVGGAIGGAASAALSPDLLKAIDPTGAALSPGQQAAMEGFATLVGGGLAGLAGANAQGGANAALNEVMNNTDDHPQTAAKNGGMLSQFGSFLSAAGSYIGDQLASAGRGAVNMGNQFIGLMNANSGQTPPSDPDPLVSASNGGNPPATGGAVVTPPAYAMTPEGPVPIAPGIAVPGLSPGNAILSSNGSDSGTGAGASGAGSAGGGSGLSAADQLAANKAAGAAFEQAVETQLNQSGYTIGQQVTIETESGVRTRLDFLTLDPLTGDVSCVECKASSTAPLTTNQKLAFPEIAQSGGTVVGAGKPGFPGGTTIPPTTVQIIRGP